MSDNDLGEWQYFEIEAFSDGSLAVMRLRDNFPAMRLLPDIAKKTHYHINLIQGNLRCKQTCTPEEYLGAQYDLRLPLRSPAQVLRL